MKFRVARHTDDLDKMIGFYTETIGVSVLGNFENHDAYDGVFLGLTNGNWELEFTVSEEKPEHFPDEDDLLVFYQDSEAEKEAIVKRAANLGIHPVKAKNPYWRQNGVILRDPDGFLVCISVRSPKLKSGNLTDIALNLEITDWNSLLEHVRHLPYGRDANRSDFGLVLTKAKGSCSSKHALLKAIADENGIPVQLLMGIYKMSRKNTPGIGNTLENSGLHYVPEAHCYLKMGGRRFDFTNPHSDISKIEADIVTEMEISPDQVVDFKVDFHKDFIRNWIVSENIGMHFDEVWRLRERCIAALS